MLVKGTDLTAPQTDDLCLCPGTVRQTQCKPCLHTLQSLPMCLSSKLKGYWGFLSHLLLVSLQLLSLTHTVSDPENQLVWDSVSIVSFSFVFSTEAASPGTPLLTIGNLKGCFFLSVHLLPHYPEVSH